MIFNLFFKIIIFAKANREAAKPVEGSAHDALVVSAFLLGASLSCLQARLLLHVAPAAPHLLPSLLHLLPAQVSLTMSMVLVGADKARTDLKNENYEKSRYKKETNRANRSRRLSTALTLSYRLQTWKFYIFVKNKYFFLKIRICVFC